MNETKTEIVSQTRLARLAAKRINDWLYDEQLDRLHDICHEVVTSEHPNLDPDALWDVLPEVFDRLRPFTVLTMAETTPIYLTDEQYAILHKMIGDQLDAVLGPFDGVEDFEPAEEHYAMLEAVTKFSSQSPFPLNVT